MRIKAKDIAKELGLSPATVSMALNDRPGVNEETKRRIREYVWKREEGIKLQEMKKTPGSKGSILILNYIKNGVIMEQEIRNSGFSETVKNKIEQMIRLAGYNCIFRVFQEKKDDLKRFIEQCRKDNIKGIYLMAAEMRTWDVYPFRELNVPIVAGDNLFYEEGIDSYLVDNNEGIRRGVDYLVDKGHSLIVYLAENIDIFNFEERREAFVSEMAKRECGDASKRVRHLGSSLDEVYEAMMSYLDEGLKGTTAFILESSVISLGVCKALLERKVRIPRDISLVGFDALPPVSLPGIELTLIKGTHTKRHLSGIEHLLRHIDKENEEIMKVYFRTRMIEGNTVFDKKKYIYQ